VPGDIGRSSRSRTRPSSSVRTWVRRIGRSSSPSLYNVTWTPTAGLPCSASSTCVEIVGVPAVASATYPPGHGPARDHGRRRPPLYRPLAGRRAPDDRGDPANAADRLEADPLPLVRRVDLDPVRRF